MNCTRVKEIIFLYTDNEMEEELLVSFREHLVLCPGCARQIKYTQRMLTVLRKGCSRTPAPESLRRRILTSLPHRRNGV
jgi:mycothiol system anti-sigma-R factor